MSWLGLLRLAHKVERALTSVVETESSLPHRGDRRYCHSLILPEVLQLLREYRELRGRVVVVQL